MHTTITAEVNTDLKKKVKLQDIKVGGHLIVTYEGESFPGKVVAIKKTKQEVKSGLKAKNQKPTKRRILLG